MRAIRSFALPNAVTSVSICRPVPYTPLKIINDSIRTNQALSKLRVGLKIITVDSHRVSHIGDWQQLLLVFGFLDFGQGLDVGRHASLHTLHACWESTLVHSLADNEFLHQLVVMLDLYSTLVSKLHLDFESFEFIGLASSDFATHTLSGPLLHAVEPLVDVHDGGCGGEGCGDCSGSGGCSIGRWMLLLLFNR